MVVGMVNVADVDNDVGYALSSKMASQQDVYTVECNTDAMHYPPRAEIHPMHEYHNYSSQGNDPSDFQGVSPIPNTNSRMPDEGHLSHPQEFPMHPIHGYHGYIPEGNDPNIYQNKISAPHYGAYPMPSNQPNMPPVITNQPYAYSGPIYPPGQGILQTPAGAPTTAPNKDIKPQTKPIIIVKRIFSVVVMLMDIILAWIQLSELNEGGGNIVFGKKRSEISCPKTQVTVFVYIVHLCFSTLCTIVQIINVIGETIYEVTGKKRGYRIVHGFNEVVTKVSVKDIPQFLLMIIAVSNGCVCTNSSKRWPKLIGSYIVARLSSGIRTSTCKQEIKKCECECECCCCCGKSCCPDEYGYTCYLCYFPICSKKFTPCMPVSICKYLGCCEKGCFNCEPSDEDPKFALQILKTLYSYQIILMLANIIVMALKCHN
ncbi:hypothetical protein CHS0354_024824 [Potamilus streckersoni]|uniref:Uncharacterized protein n=1 Tax=Potamilus streckersoni TaxID=2493646 RepID=A0AAE0SZU2_9BIVA|nr:hypothetical protein CHS0354_024824 [Potamilus streckersoni]